MNELPRKAAYALKQRFPNIVFTSGRRNRVDQARAMASNVAFNRKWISQTYSPSPASQACQKWVDDHLEAVTKEAIADGLFSVLNGFADVDLRRLSKHLSGDAFDVQPVVQNAEAIKDFIRHLP
ncbi:MAG: hypothetical protein ACREVW_16135, partial [Burkholderiales bacterium]